MKKLKIAGAALNQTPLDWENNFNNIVDAVSEARKKGVNLLCLPELCLTGYGCEDLFLSNWLSEKAWGKLIQILPHTENIAVTLGLPVRVDGSLDNCAAVIVNGKITGITAKQFLANDGVHYEPRWFTPWQRGTKTVLQRNGFDIPFGDVIHTIYGIRTGFEICEDAWREDRPAITFPGRNVELILNPSASHFAFGKSKLREELVVKSSETFHACYVYVNLLGNEAGRMIYDGEIVMAGHGRLLKHNEKLSFKNVNLTSIDIDFDNKCQDAPRISIPEENKNDIFVRAEALALFDYLRKSHNKGFVLSLSGGADSTTCAILVAEMVRRSIAELGVENMVRKINMDHLIREAGDNLKEQPMKFITGQLLTCAYQGTVNSSEETLRSAEWLTKEIGAGFHHWLIDDEVKAYSQIIENVLGRKLDWTTDDIAMQNIQSRSRAPVIWMLANIKHALLLVTSNRSEGSLGYATMDGDTSGSIAPIAAVDKYFILNWLKWAESDLGYSSLHYVNSLQPTAELRPPDKSQTDEKDLMPYRIITEIEVLAIRDHLSPKEVFTRLKAKNLEAEDLLKEHIKKFFLLWSRNQWKRERTAPAFHLDDFNVDPRTWCRFPILSGSFKEELEEL
jgi:NAD+ synthase (glutamine-hydrolysing)